MHLHSYKGVLMITLEELKNEVNSIKEDFYEGNDSHSRAEYKGACESLDILILRLEKVNIKGVII